MDGSPAQRGGGWQLEVGCALLVLAACWPFLLGRVTCLDDLQRIALPLLALVQRALGDGELLVWAPELFCGYSAHAAGQAGSHYPPHLLLLAGLPLLWAFKATVALHLWLLARGVLGLARELGATPRGALAAAGVAALGGATAGHHHHLNIIIGMGWTGPILWLSARAVRDRTPLSALLLGGAYGLALLAAQPQYVFYAALASVPVLLAARDPELPGQQVGLRLFLAAAAALVLAWVQLLPTIEHVRLNPRPRLEGDWAFLTRIALEGRDALRLLNPDLFGTPLRGTWAADAPSYWEARGQLGAPFLALALARLLRRPWDTALARAGLGLVAIGVLFAPGAASPLTYLTVHLPPFNLFRNPARFVWLIQLGVALLAADELGALGRPARRPRAIALGVVGAWALLALALSARAGRLGDWLLRPGGLALALGLLAIGAAFLARTATRRRAVPLAVGLGLLELTLAWHAFALTVPDAALREPPPLAAPILAAPADRRRTLDLVAPPPTPGIGTSERLRSNSGAIWGVTYFTGGNEALPPLLQVAHLERLRQTSEAPGFALPQLQTRFEPACDRFGVRWIVTGRSLPADADLREVAEVGGVRLYQNVDARPPAYTLGVRWLAAGGVVSTPADRDVRVTAAEVLERGRGRWRVRSAGALPRFLVVEETWDVAWEATVDGAPAETTVAEELFVAVAVPPGEHVVELRYRPSEVTQARWISGLAWPVWLLVVVAVWRRREPGDA